MSSVEIISSEDQIGKIFTISHGVRPTDLSPEFKQSENENENENCEVLVAVCKYSLIAFESSGKILKKYETINRAVIIDAIYLAPSRCFVIATETMLASVPIESKSARDYHVQPWPHKVTRLAALSSDYSSIYFIFSDNTLLCTSTLKDRKPVGAPLSQPKSFISGKLNKDQISLISDLNTNSFQSLGFLIENRLTNQLNLVLHTAKSKESSISEWITDSEVNVLFLGTIGKQSKESVMNVVKSVLRANNTSDSFSIILEGSENKNKNIRYLKVDSKGNKLLSRDLTSFPEDVVVGESSLYFINEQGTSGLTFNLNYGIVGQSFSIPSASGGSNSSDKWYFVSAAHGELVLLHFSSAAAGSKSLVHRVTIEFSEISEKGSLFSSLGAVSLVKPTAASQKPGPITTSLPATVASQIQNNLSKYYDKIFIDEKQYDSNLLKHYQAHSKAMRTKAFFVNLESSIITQFLEAFNSLSIEKVETIDDLDWEVVKLLIRSGHLSIYKNDQIVKQAIFHERLDVLAEIIRFVSDLSENNAISIIHFVATHHLDLSNYEVIGASLVHHNAANEAFTAKLQIASQVTGDSEGKSKKRKKSTEEIPKIEATAPITAVELIQVFVELLLSRSVSFSPLLIAEAIQKLILNPQSSAVTAEERHSSICFLSIFIRVLVQVIKSFFALYGENDRQVVKKRKTLTANTYRLNQLTDAQLNNAVIWLEGILDASFLHFTLHLNQTGTESSAVAKEIKQALFAVLEVVQLLESDFRDETSSTEPTELQRLQELLSFVMIYDRMRKFNISSGSSGSAAAATSQKPSKQLYQFEKLVF